MSSWEMLVAKPQNHETKDWQTSLKRLLVTRQSPYPQRISRLADPKKRRCQGKPNSVSAALRGSMGLSRTSGRNSERSSVVSGSFSLGIQKSSHRLVLLTLCLLLLLPLRYDSLLSCVRRDVTIHGLMNVKRSESVDRLETSVMEASSRHCSPG